MLRGLFIALCSLVLAFQIWQCIEKFSKFDTKLLLSLRSNDHFPSVTVCPAYKEAYKQEILNFYGSTKSEYRKGNFSVNSNKNPWRIFDEINYNFKEIIEDVTVSNSQRNQIQISEKFSVTFGKCYSMEFKDFQEIQSMKIVTKIDTYLYLHHPGQFMGIDEKSKVSTEIGEHS